jgi:hypothetical protein
VPILGSSRRLVRTKFAQPPRSTLSCTTVQPMDKYRIMGQASISHLRTQLVGTAQLSSLGKGKLNGIGIGADGFVAMESVQISNITAPSQAIGLISSSNVTFGSSISGVLGLSFPRLSTISRSLTTGTSETTLGWRGLDEADITAPTGTPFFSTLAQQGMVSYPLFGLSLRRDSAGSLTLGAIDASVLTNVSLVQWNPVYSFAPFNAASLTVASETSASSSSSAASASSTAISTVPVARNASGYLHWAIKLDGFGVNGTEFQPWPTYVKETGNASLALTDV